MSTTLVRLVRPVLLGCLLLLLAGPAVAGRPQVRQFSLTKAQLAELLGPRIQALVSSRELLVRDRGLGLLAVEPTIDHRLQRRAERLLLRKRGNRAAVVVLEAATGRVLVLAGVRRRRLDPRVALRADAPAASLFKVITAAAALEEVDLRPSTRLAFVGRPHTLYRYQVRERLRRRPRRVTLRRSFAQSNNPVFARLGMHWLGGELLLWYARALGFGRRLAFELPVGISRLARPRDDFQVGELACGYNRETTLSPLHAALMVAVFVNGGRFMEPFVVARVEGPGGRVLYRGRPSGGPRLVSESTCRAMRRLLAATVTEGTAAYAFRRARRDRVLKGLILGGKTGTLRGRDRRELFEWFAGFGQDPASGRAIAICTLAVHGKRRYVDPKRLARQVLREAFRTLAAGSSRVAGHM